MMRFRSDRWQHGQPSLIRSLHHPGEVVPLCWLALLLIRVVETTTDHTWHHVREHPDELRLGHVHRPGRAPTVNAPS